MVSTGARLARTLERWARGVGMDDLEHFRAQVERLLDLADEQLVSQERDWLRAAVEQPPERWFAVVGGTLSWAGARAG